MGEKLLYEAVQKGYPLVEFSISFAEETNSIQFTNQLNSLSEDFHVCETPWYDDPQLRIASATKEALKRLFNWEIRRVPIPDGDNLFWWEAVNSPMLPIEIEEMGLSQPGADDQGQWYDG